ncbi:MAG TPA: Asp-tRNA(Asn)/Glu-tRNA(Gln) amidotransferase subunit GatC [Longimicrobiales bacterium]
MAVSREDVLKIAALARLRLTPEEVERFAAQLGTILDHIGVLGEVEEAALPAEPVEWPAPLREDGGHPDPLALPPRELAPAWEEGFFAVPRLPALDTAALEDAFEDKARVEEERRPEPPAGRARP